MIDAEQTVGDPGEDVVFGDNGIATWDLVDTGSGDQSVLATVASTATDLGGDDVIETGEADDVAIGGPGNDLINDVLDPVTGLPVQTGVDSGDDMGIGDNGAATFDTSTGEPVVEFVTTTAPGDYGDDFIFLGDGSDVGIGGSGDDTVDAQSSGSTDTSVDFVIGDNGLLIFDTTLGRPIIEAVSTIDPSFGGNDTLFTGQGPDVAFGGLGDDVIDTGNGHGGDVVVGDSGFALFSSGTPYYITSTDPTLAGDDVIRAQNGPDLVIGGSGSDIIHAGTDYSIDWNRDVVIGDNGQIWLDVVGAVSLVQTSDSLYGAYDWITTGGGKDVVFGGSGPDAIYSGFDEDVVVGDNGRADFVNARGIATDLLQKLDVLDPYNGGNDYIWSGAHNDIVIGGSFHDEIYGGAGNDMLVGDHATFDRSLPRDFWLQSTFTGANFNGGVDTIHGDDGPLDGFSFFSFFSDFDDFIIGGQEGDFLYGGLGEDDIIGGHNTIGGLDGNDVIDGEEAADVIIGDNGRILRRYTGPGFEDFERYPAPFSDVERRIERFDEIDGIGGHDVIDGSGGRDIIWGQRGNDWINGGDGDDDLIGNLGHDHIDGGAGHDVIIAENGTIARAFNADGTPRRNADGSWRRDVILEDQGVIIDYIQAGLDQFRVTDPNLAKRILSADLVLAAGIGGSTFAPWDTLLILIELLPAEGNWLKGGDGNDLIFGGPGNDMASGGRGNDLVSGGLGNDQITGDRGNDVLVGDDVSNNSLLNTAMARILRGVRIVDDTTFQPLTRVQLADGGVLVVPEAMIRAEATVCAADRAPGLAQLHTGQIGVDDTLTRTDGTTLPTVVALIPDPVHNPHAAPGNDDLDGGRGDDIVIGDHATFWEPAPTQFPEIDAAMNSLANSLATLVADVAQLAIDADIAQATRFGLGTGPGGFGIFHPNHDVQIASDLVRGGRGDDLLIGGSTILETPNDLRLLKDDEFVAATIATYQSIKTINHVAVDLSSVVVEAQAAVLNQLVAQAASITAAPGSIDLDLHDVTVDADTIDGRALVGVFGDEDPDLVTGGDAIFSSGRNDTITLTEELAERVDDALTEAALASPADAEATPQIDNRTLWPDQAAIDGLPFDRSCNNTNALDQLILEQFDTLLPSNPVLPATDRLDGHINDLEIDD